MTTELTKGTMAKLRLPELLRSLSAWVGPSRTEVGSEHPPEEHTEGSLHLVERPVDRSLLWLPGGWGEQRTRRPYPYELFVAQDVLQDVETHALEEMEGSYGLLTGQLLACKKTRVPFVSVEASHRSESPMPVGEDLTSFREFFWKVGEVAGRRGRVLVGWYHTHSLLGLQLSERDRQIHVAHFHDEWPCALVVVTRKGASEGGFFQRDRGDILFRRSTRPFRELVNQKVKPGGGPYVTAVAWGNYWSHEPVLFVRRPGDLPSKGGKWSLRQRPRIGSGSDQKVADLAARPSQEPAAAESRADVLRPTTAAQRGGAELTYEKAMGRPVRDETRVAESRSSDPAGPPPQEVWDEWKRALEVRRVREDEIRKVEAERAATDAAKAHADTTARSKAALAARAAAAAAARAAAEALGIRSEGDTIAEEAMAKAEVDAEALVAEEQAARRAAKETIEKEAAKEPKPEEPEEAAKEPKPEEPEEAAPASVSEAEAKVQPEPVSEAEAKVQPEPVSEAEAEVEAEVGALAEEIEERASEAEQEPEPVSEAEPAPEVEPALTIEAADLGEPSGLAEAEVQPEPALELGSEPRPEAEVVDGDELFGLEPVAAGRSELDRRETEPQPAEDGEMVMTTFLLPDPLPRPKFRRYAVWAGIGLPLAAALAWILLG